MTVAAIICARMDSKRFPGKVLAPLAGKPLIQHTIDFAREMGWPLYVMTYDLEIAQYVADQCAIIWEPERFYQDRQADLTYEMMQFANRIIKADLLVLLQPTQPVRDATFILHCMRSIETWHMAHTDVWRLLEDGDIVEKSGLFYSFSAEYLRLNEKKRPWIFVYQGKWFDIDTEDDLGRCEEWIRG
jgi:CMP-2-keto-3-deoxyoctulosonic acid synthetase